MGKERRIVSECTDHFVPTPGWVVGIEDWELGNVEGRPRVARRVQNH